jgi:SAM-dependent methyltransferase
LTDRRELTLKQPEERQRVKLYDEVAEWWPLMSPPAEYQEEAEFYQRALLEACRRPRPHTLLELGSGGGNNASFLKSRFRMTLVDRSPGMLAVSRKLNPECEHVEGDMRTVRLDGQFDCVFVHDAIVYMTTEDDLKRAMATAFVHCQPGGAALFAPDSVREKFRETTDCGGHDDGARGLRYLEWKWDPEPNDSTINVDYVYVLRGIDRTTRVVHDRHVEGLFSSSEWLRLLSDAGFEPRALAFDHSELEPGTYVVFVCTKPR